MTDFDHDDLLKQLDRLNMDVPPLPEGFHEGWTSRLEDTMDTKRKTPIKTILTRVLSVAAALIFIIGGTMVAQQTKEQTAKQAARSSVQATSYTSANNDTAAGGVPLYGRLMGASEAYDEEYEFDDGVAAGTALSMAEAPSTQMLIRSASLTIGTQRYDESLSGLLALCESSGGWTSSSSENTYNGLRTCYLTLRIPAENLDGFLSGTAGLGRITSRSESAEDVTESYHDTRARLETQQALMARLQALVTDAASLSDLLELEEQIANTQYQIDRLQSSLNSTERQVNFSTVDVTLREERAAADITDVEKPLGERIVSALREGGEAFLQLMENTAIWLAAALPFIAIVVVAWIVVKLIRRKK